MVCVYIWHFFFWFIQQNIYDNKFENGIQYIVTLMMCLFVGMKCKTALFS